MKPSHISIALLVVSLFFAPALFAQSPDAANQSAISPAPAVSAAEVPRLIKFSGSLLDEQGHALAGPVGVTFALYAQQTGGAALWLETQNVKPDANGNYMVLLGANSAKGVPAELFTSNEARWLGIQVAQQPEHERVLLVSVPYALKAGDAETLGGKPASAYLTTETLASTATSGATTAASTSSTSNALLKSSAATTKKTASTPQPAAPCTSVTSDGTATVGAISMFTAPCIIQSSVITQSSGNVGIGTATPAVAVDVVGNNAGLRLNGTGTHQVTVTSTTTGVSGRLGQDATGFFFSSDTNGKVIKFLTNNGVLNEWMRITSAGNVGIHTQTPAAPLEVAGNIKISGTGNGTIFPDGTLQTTAAASAPLVSTVTMASGTSITSGTCITQGVTVTGATTAMTAVISPAGDPSTNGLNEVLWSAFVDASNHVTAQFCHFSRTTASAASNQVFNIRVIR